LNGAADVFICEGEKDADRLMAHGLTVVTDLAGAWQNEQNPKWLAGYNPHLTLKNVYILPDNDDAGRVRAAYIAASLSGIAASVRIVNLPDLPEKGDVSDWLDGGGDGRTLTEICRFAPRFDIDAVGLFKKSSGLDAATASGVEQWAYGAINITRKPEKCDCGKCKGAAVVTFWEGETGVSRMSNATRHECKKRLHQDAWRISQQAWQEMKAAAVYLVRMEFTDSIKWQNRNRKRDTAHRFQHIPLADGTSALLTTDDTLGGDKLPVDGDAIYDLVLSLLAESDAEKRISGTKSKQGENIFTIGVVAWGQSYQGMRGNGRRKMETSANKRQCSQYYAKQNTAREVAKILGATWTGATARVQIDAITAFEKLTEAGVTLQLRSIHTDIFSIGIGANESDLRQLSRFKHIVKEPSSMCLNRENEPAQGAFDWSQAAKNEPACLHMQEILDEIPF
jgi:hypothetical protein